MRYVRCILLLAMIVRPSVSKSETPPPRSAPTNFETSNLIAWCIVPFDATQRDAEARSSMLRRLGLRRAAYDWRAEHVSKFEDEILAYKKHGIEYFAFWSWHDDMEALIKKHQITPQIWQICKTTEKGSDEDKVAIAVQNLMPIVQKAKSLGLKLGLYNHGGWAGEPKNMVAICEELRRTHEADHVGIVYNFHHGHEHMDAFADHLALMTPYLLCVNLNGMMDAQATIDDARKNKIVPIGAGVHEQQMIQTLVASGYDGPIGIIGHRQELDAEKVLLGNINGLNRTIKELAKESE
jgi:hypothetical protein